MLPALDRGTPRPYDRQTPSPLFDDEDSPLIASQAELSLSKKRGWADEAGDDEAASIASKRALRSIGTPQRPSPQSRAEAAAKGRTPSHEDAQNVCKDARQAVSMILSSLLRPSVKLSMRRSLLDPTIVHLAGWQCQARPAS